MEKHQAKKALGQNFLKDNQSAQLMVRTLNMQPNDSIVEIGGGTGVLTRLIVERKNNYKSLTVFELDQDLKPTLEKILEPSQKSNLIFENFLDTHLDDIEEGYKLIGSLPYYITSPIIHKVLREKNRPEIAVFLVQKEVGEKLTSKVPRASYWSYTTLGYKVEKVAIVKAEMFSPVPKVDSMIIKFTRIKEDEETLRNIGFTKWEKFLHHVFKNPRKMINKTFDKELLQSLGINPSLRSQDLELADIMKLLQNKEDTKNISA